MLKATLLLVCSGLISLLAWPLVQDVAITGVLAMLVFVLLAPWILTDHQDERRAGQHVWRGR